MPNNYTQQMINGSGHPASLLRTGIRIILFTILTGWCEAQTSIAWQKSIGTERGDNALQLFPDEQGNLIFIGKEPHPDFTGQVREYMVISKITSSGEEIWKTYHDVAFETFSIPVDYYFGDHFYTEESGDTLLNLVLRIHDRTLLYKILDRTGDYYFYEEISSGVIDVNRENEKVYASVLCSVQQACYGPDSLVVEKFDPSPDSIIFNPIEWTFEMKQGFRTAPIQGHYDFDVQDIRTDTAGNVYLLVQIERWDFQFCTDCADAFVDAWCEIFQFNPDGELVRHVNLKTAKAVVSSMGFIGDVDKAIMVAVNDINAAGTKVITTICRLDKDLNLQKKFDLPDAYYLVQADNAQNLYACTNVFDQNDPDIKGLSDVLVAKYDPDGLFLWKSYYGGSNFEFPKGLALGADGGIYFFANTESTDFDVAENLGSQDMWLVKLLEGTTAVEETASSNPIPVFPNPCGDLIFIPVEEEMNISLYDPQGRVVFQNYVNPSSRQLNLEGLPAGLYMLKATNTSQQIFSGKVVKM